MKLRLPEIEIEHEGKGYAKRLGSLQGARIAFVDGWGAKHGDQTVTMYPTMVELARLLEERCGIGEWEWIRKESVSRPVSEAEVVRLSKEVDAVINGEGL